MPEKEISTPYPLIDADPHFKRVVGYFRPSDYVVWAAGTAGFPGALHFWELVDKTKAPMKVVYRLGGVLGFFGGFLLAYQRSSMRFWGWTENKREEERDFLELSQRAREGKPLYGESSQPANVKGIAYRNSAYSALKFHAIPMFNFVNHPYHGTDPAKYGVKPQQEEMPQQAETRSETE